MSHRPRPTPEEVRGLANAACTGANVTLSSDVVLGISEALVERFAMIKALREMFDDTGYCGLCKNHHWIDQDYCPVMERDPVAPEKE